MDKSTISKFGFTSQAFHTVMKENVDMLIPPIRNSIFQNSVDKLTILHGVIRDEDLKAVDSHNKNLLFYAVYYESLACLLYLLRRGIERDGVDD